MTVRVGIVGAGGVAQRHARVLAGFADVRLVGVTDVVSGAAERLAGEHDAAVFADVPALLGAGLDAVYVCVPPFAHGPAERAIAEAGLPLFVEKPISVDLDTALETAEIITRNALVTAVGHHWRYLGVVEQARTLLGDRPVRLVSGAWLDKVPPVAWWPLRSRSGGPVVEQAAHVLDLARHLVGEVREVVAMGNGVPPEVDGADVDGATVAALRFAGGAVGTLAATCVLGWKQRAGLEIFADGLYLGLTENELVVRDSGGERTVPGDPEAARVAVDRAFVDAVSGRGDDVRVPYAEALRTHALALAVAESAATGRPVRPADGRRASGTTGVVGWAVVPEYERNVVVTAPGRVEIVEEPTAPVGPGGFRVRTLFTGVSAGTELSYLKGTNPYLSTGWDARLGLFTPGRPATPYPVTRLGYMEVARVEQSRTPAVDEGTVVAMTYGHRTGFVGDPVADRVVPLPDDLDPVLGIYVAHMGPICANGLLHAAADLHGTAVRSLADGVRGRRVAVTGAGVVALLTALFARRHGAASVVVIDPTAHRRAVAEALGLATLDPDAVDADPAAVLKTRWRHTADDRGADVVFQCRGQASALHLALRLLRPQGTVVDLAFYQGGADAVRLGEEFHHNGLGLRCAQIGRVPRGLAPTWDRERLSAETVDLLRQDGEAIRKHLVSDVVGFDEAPALLTAMAAGQRHTVQAVLAC